MSGKLPRSSPKLELTMSIRTTSSAVQLVLSKEYDTVNNPDLSTYIEIASAVVDDVATCASAKGQAHTSTRLELIERVLSAHYYTKMDPVYTSRSTISASGSYVRDPKNPEPFKSMALELDGTGCLAAILAGSRAGMTWLGKPPSEQIPYYRRD